MLKSLLNYLAPPVFPDDEEKTRKARYANVIALTFIFVALGYETGTRLAIANAVVDALWHLGVRNIDIPITARKVWEVLSKHGATLEE